MIYTKLWVLSTDGHGVSIAREHIWKLLYWPALEFCGEPPQVSAVRAGGFWSGFMSEARGLSWDRKSRYGKK